jgi:hypothetical protein
MENLGFPATIEEIRKSGSRVRKLFLRPPPLKLQKSFAAAAMSWEEDRPAKRSLKIRDEDRSGPRDRAYEDRDAKSKRQQGMDALEGGSRIQGGEDSGNQRGFQGRRQDDKSGQAPGPHRQGGGGGQLRQLQRAQDQEGK